MSSTERSLTSPDGTKIWAESVGDPSKPAIVFVHGLSCSAFGFEHQFGDQDLVDNFYLVRYELRGHGRSGQPDEAKDYESLRFAEDFRTVCESFGLKRPFFAGWSLGGAVAADVIDAYGPSYLSGVIYGGGGILHTHYIPQCIRPEMYPRLQMALSESADDMARAADVWVDSCVAPGAPFLYATKLQWMGAFVAQSRIARMLSVERRQSHERWAELVRDVPVLIVQGTADQHCVYENMVAIAKSVYAEVEVEMLEGAGHSPCFERPGETNRIIRAWVNKIVKRGV